MHKNLKIALVLAILVVVAFGAAVWGMYTFKPFTPLKPAPPPPAGNPADLEVYYVGDAVVSSLNVALLVFLLISSSDTFRKTRSKFTFGLLLFISAFLVDVLTSNPLVIWVFGFHPEGLGPFALLPDVFELIVLATLMYLSFE